VSKRLGSRYRSGRSKDGLKFKNPDAPAMKREEEEDLATEADVTRPALGTVEWFKGEMLHLIELAKAIDSFAAARRSFQKLIDLGPNGDPDLRAAAHTSGVVCYARPFVYNKRADGTRGVFQKKLVKTNANYDEGIHRELFELRQKIVAHSDRDYVEGRVFTKSLALDIEQEETKWIVGATVVTQTVHTLHDINLTKQFLSHIEGVEQAAYAEATKRLEDFVRMAQSFPEQLQLARSPGAKGPITTERFEMPPDKAVFVPYQTLNPNAVLTKPPLKLGQDGYMFRGFGVQVDVSTEITRTGDDGSKAVIRWEVTKDSDSGDAVSKASESPDT
jgi:hypothetical protein